MRKFIVKTLGCKVNQYESAAIAQSLINSACSPAEDGEPADLCIVNTCAVTQKAAMQSRQTIRQMIRSHPQAHVIVTGCYAQIDQRHISESIDGIHEIVDNTHKHTIPLRIDRQPETNRPYPHLTCGDIQLERQFKFIPTTVLGDRTRPFLKVQDGCNSKCSYCVVPLARGKSRSMPVEDVLANIKALKQADFHEVVLTGIHLGSYGKDLSPKTSLLQLLKNILAANPIERIRLSSIEPRDLTDDIIEMVADGGVGDAAICHHFHIPLQSGDDPILIKMRRPYTRSFFRNLILKIHRRLPEAAIGVDTLIGFPGESDQAFKNTYSLLEELPVSYLHVFPFSPREGTPAYDYPDHVSANMLKERCDMMRRLSETKKRGFYRRFLDTSLQILVEGARDKKTGRLKGFTSNYIPVLCQGDDGLKNTLLEVKLEKADGHRVVMGSQTNPISR